MKFLAIIAVTRKRGEAADAVKLSVNGIMCTILACQE